MDVDQANLDARLQGLHDLAGQLTTERAERAEQVRERVRERVSSSGSTLDAAGVEGALDLLGLGDRRYPDRDAAEEETRVTDADHSPEPAPEYAPLPANVRTGFATRAGAADPGPGAVALFWLGQEGILLKSEDVTLLIDPFLCQYPARLVPPADAPEAFAFVDYVLATHEHLDHLDLAAWQRFAAAAEAIRFVAPRAILDQITAAGIDPERVIAADPGEALELGPATVVPIRGVHGISMETGYTDGTDHPPGLPRFLGYVVDLAGLRIYHAGDTIFVDGLVEQLADLAVDIALLPINGRDHLREKAGLVGNMGPREAADLAAAIGAKVVVPLHYDLMRGNTEEPGHFLDYLSRTYPDITALVLGRFAGLTLGKPV